MSKIEIEWLVDEYDCDTCGSNWAEGAVVKIDGELVFDLSPSAHCYAGVSYSQEDIYKKILNHLHEVVEI